MEMILSIIAENFWLLLLLGVMIGFQSFRLCGILLLASVVLFGYIHWLFIGMLTLNTIAVFYKDNKNVVPSMKDKKDNKRKDPDYE